MKYCKNCKWSHGFINDDWAFLAKCKKTPDEKNDPVTGENMNCDQARLKGEFCGPDAKYFEKQK